MKISDLVRYLCEGEYGDGVTRVTTRETLAEEQRYGTPWVEVPGAPLLEELAEFCDHHAENANHHSFVGTHRSLANLLLVVAGRDAAKQVFEAITRAGGLHELEGADLTRFLQE